MINSHAIDNSGCPLVLVSGTLCNARLWQPLIEQLNVSTVTCHTLTQATANAASRQLLQGLPPRFMLVGFSLGAIVALQLAADAPGRLAGLALLSVNPLAGSPESASDRRAACRAAHQQGHGRWLSDNLWQHYVAPAGYQNRALHDTLCRMADETPPEVFARQTEIAITRSDNRAALAALRCPLLIINGLHDPICTPEHHRLAAASARHATLITLNNAGHFLVLEAVSETAAAIRSWIEESLHANQ